MGIILTAWGCLRGLELMYILLSEGRHSMDGIISDIIISLPMSIVLYRTFSYTFCISAHVSFHSTNDESGYSFGLTSREQYKQLLCL